MENLTGGTPPVRYLPCVVPCKLYFTTDKGIRYEIGGKGDIINTIEPKDQGLQVLRVYKQNEDGTWNYTDDYLQIGSELD